MRVPAELLTFARQLRQGQTDAEVFMWHLLRDRRFCGHKFRRQYPLAGYILDFYCPAAKLTIELDGGGHNDDEQRRYDRERTKVLESAGIRIVRFWNHDVLNDLDSVLEVIYAELAKR
jgi:very-short-patch-repair endonuclease